MAGISTTNVILPFGITGSCTTYETGFVQKGLRVPCSRVGHGHADKACPTRLCSVSCFRTRVSEDCQCEFEKQDTFSTKKRPRIALNKNFHFFFIICKCGEGSKVCLMCGEEDLKDLNV